MIVMRESILRAQYCCAVTGGKQIKSLICPALSKTAPLWWTERGSGSSCHTNKGDYTNWRVCFENYQRWAGVPTTLRVCFPRKPISMRWLEHVSKSWRLFFKTLSEQIASALFQCWASDSEVGPTPGRRVYWTLMQYIYTYAHAFIIQVLSSTLVNIIKIMTSHVRHFIWV